jgi:hypothetical protein
VAQQHVQEQCGAEHLQLHLAAAKGACWSAEILLLQQVLLMEPQLREQQAVLLTVQAC